MKKPLIVLLCVLVVVALVGVLAFAIYKGRNPYDPDDFIGLTSVEIVEKHGKFDHRHSSPSPDGLYRNTMCGYIVKEAVVGFLGTYPLEYYQYSISRYI